MIPHSVAGALTLWFDQRRKSPLCRLLFLCAAATAAVVTAAALVLSSLLLQGCNSIDILGNHPPTPTLIWVGISSAVT